MAARTALVVRQPTSPPPRAATVTATLKRRSGRSSSRGKMGLRQVGMGVAGAATSAAVTAGLCAWLGMRPQYAGLATGGLGALGAVAFTGPDVRPFAAGAALSGGAVALSSWIGHFSSPTKKPKDEKKDPTKDDTQKQLAGGSAPDVVNAPPANAKNANGTPAPRSAGSVSDEMRQQIRQAMRDTRYRG